jgi:NAD dependent epimerase/dehydratase family enzyme
MKILIAGASGLVGSALVPALRGQGHEVVTLVRRPVRREDEIEWNPSAGKLEPAVLATTDAVINLAGENIAAGRWTAVRKEVLRGSRLDSTRTLVRAMARAEPRPRVLVNASAVGFYGDRSDEALTEDSPVGCGSARPGKPKHGRRSRWARGWCGCGSVSCSRGREERSPDCCRSFDGGWVAGWATGAPG